MNQLIALGVAALVGFGCAWNVQAWRWDADAASLRDQASKALVVAYADRDEKIAQAEARKEELQIEFDKFKASEADRDNAVDRGERIVYVRAKCPSVPSASTDSSRTESGAAELDPAYRRTLSKLREGVEEQRRLLNDCRAELGIK